MATEKRQPDLDPDTPPSEEEIAESAKLREALANPTVASADADLLRALAHAHAPREIDPLAHGAIVSFAVAKAPRRAVVVRVAFGFATVVAAAALILLFIRTRLPRPEATVTAEVSVSRSTQPLFAEPFAAQGGESARIDRIAMAREADLRENRFSRWGVR
jgi:hypothetical protein